MGKVLKHAIQDVPNLAGFLIEDICVVPVDPRIAQYGTCTGHSLPVGQVCAGYGNTVISDYLCGGSGGTGTGFALIKSITNSDNQLAGALVANDADSSTVLPGNNPPCPQTVLAWAPLAGEGTVVEGKNLGVRLARRGQPGQLHGHCRQPQSLGGRARPSGESLHDDQHPAPRQSAGAHVASAVSPRPRRARATG